MAKKAKIDPKAEIQAYIMEKLDESLVRIKEGMSDKKFKRNLKKVSKMLADDFKPRKQKVVIVSEIVTNA
jgi:hypothetical protein